MSLKDSGSYHLRWPTSPGDRAVAIKVEEHGAHTVISNLFNAQPAGTQHSPKKSKEKRRKNKE
jgi:hypothetical protein